MIGQNWARMSQLPAGTCYLDAEQRTKFQMWSIKSKILKLNVAVLRYHISAFLGEKGVPKMYIYFRDYSTKPKTFYN